jgi:hypothetical protein
MGIISSDQPRPGGLRYPPADDGAGADRDRPASCLLRITASIDSRTNASTAFCDTDDVHNASKIQVTFVVADPPQVSYFCAYCTGSIFTEKPTILRTEGSLALLHTSVSKPNCYGLDRYAFYVYHANGGSGGEPSLTMLPQPSGRRIVERSQIGLLPGPGGTRDYHVAALLNASGSGQLHYELYVYSSKTRAWTVKKPVLMLNEQQRQAGEFRHITAKVITVGGDYGTMGFVDHSRGILFCNVLQGDCPHLHYVPLPTPLHHSRLDPHDAWRVSDIAVDTKGGRIRFLELCPREKTHGWRAVTWSRSAANYQEGWRHDCDLLPSQLLSGDLPEQLPLPRESCWDNRGRPPPLTTRDIERMYTEFPTLSLHEDNTMYLMISRHIGARNWWVIAVDTANMTLQDVAYYRPESRLIFRHSKISNHLNMGASPAARKRPGVEALESSRKKKFILSMVDDMVSSSVGQQEQHQDAGTIKGAQYGDDMDLDMTTLLIEH